MRNLFLLQQRAWYELAVGEHNFANIEIDPITQATSSLLGFSQPKAPMRELVECVTQAIFEHYEPDFKKLDMLPDLDNPLIVNFASNVDTPILIPHKLLEKPRGWLVLDQDLPIVIYSTQSDRLLWSSTFIILRAKWIETPGSPEIATVKIGLF